MIRFLISLFLLLNIFASSGQQIINKIDVLDLLSKNEATRLTNGQLIRIKVDTAYVISKDYAKQVDRLIEAWNFVKKRQGKFNEIVENLNDNLNSAERNADLALSETLTSIDVANKMAIIIKEQKDTIANQRVVIKSLEQNVKKLEEDLDRDNWNTILYSGGIGVLAGVILGLLL